MAHAVGAQAQDRAPIAFSDAMEYFEENCVVEQSLGDLRDMYSYLVESDEWIELEPGWFQNIDVALDFSVVLTGRATADCVVAFEAAEGIEYADEYFHLFYPQLEAVSENVTTQVVNENTFRVTRGRDIWEISGFFPRDSGVAFLHSRLLN